jgi:hypothetical protein
VGFVVLLRADDDEDAGIEFGDGELGRFGFSFFSFLSRFVLSFFGFSESFPSFFNSLLSLFGLCLCFDFSPLSLLPEPEDDDDFSIPLLLEATGGNFVGFGDEFDRGSDFLSGAPKRSVKVLVGFASSGRFEDFLRSLCDGIGADLPYESLFL